MERLRLNFKIYLSQVATFLWIIRVCSQNRSRTYLIRSNLTRLSTEFKQSTNSLKDNTTQTARTLIAWGVSISSYWWTFRCLKWMDSRPPSKLWHWHSVLHQKPDPTLSESPLTPIRNLGRRGWKAVVWKYGTNLSIKTRLCKLCLSITSDWARIKLNIINR